MAMKPRTIFYTLFNIMLDVLKKDPKASFFFIGAEDEKDEPGRTTRRFRVYHRFVSSAKNDVHIACIYRIIVARIIVTACTHIIKERAQICARSFCINSYLSGLSHRHS